MKNITNYAKEFSKTFYEKDFNEVDSLVFSQLSYLKIDEIWKERQGQPLTLKELYEINDKNVYSIRKGEENKKLLRNMIEGVRFSDVTIIDHIDIKDESIDEQFSVTVYAFKDTAYVAYRGTDRSMIGWSEDINKGYMEIVPAEQDSVIYINRIARILPDNFYIGGHSKGGHLAIFSSTYAEDWIKPRIIRIFNHDGPGMDKIHFETDNYSQIKDKIITTLPENSFFGIMLYSDENYYIVKSNAFWIQQHDPFSWCIRYNSFIYEKSLSPSSQKLKHSMNAWLNDTDKESRALFFKVLTDFIDQTKAQRPLDIGLNFAKTIPMFFASYDKLPPDDLKKIKYMLRLFFKLMKTVETSGHTEKPLRIVEGFKVFKGSLFPKNAVAYDIDGNKLKKPIDNDDVNTTLDVPKLDDDGSTENEYISDENFSHKSDDEINDVNAEDTNNKNNENDKTFNIDLKKIFNISDKQLNSLKNLFKSSKQQHSETLSVDENVKISKAKVVKDAKEPTEAVEPSNVGETEN